MRLENPRGLFVLRYGYTVVVVVHDLSILHCCAEVLLNWFCSVVSASGRQKASHG